jgi:thioredoxin reductase
MHFDTTYDAIVIGGGPAGLATAMWLARYRHRTLLVDSGNPRNKVTWAVHGYLGLEDVAPQDLRRVGREQAERAGARIEDCAVASVTGEVDAFEVTLEDGRCHTARRILIATGLRDIIPEIPGLMDFYGSSIWHCPDCDGPGVTGLRVGVLGWGRQIAGFCMKMLTWTDDLTLLTHGHDPDLPERSRATLDRFRIPVDERPIVRLEGDNGCVREVVFADGRTQKVDALFFHIAYGPGSPIPAELGCRADEGGILETDGSYETSVPGVYAAGDIVHGSKLAIRAAADGTRAAIAIFNSLLPEERRV